MAKFLSEKELYPTVKERSAQTKNVLWVCSPYLGLNAHEVFSEEIAKNPPKHVRFIFKLEKRSVEKGAVNPHEIEYFKKHVKKCKIKTNNTFHSKIYIFDDSALVTSANLSKAAFEKSIEAGVILTGEQVKKVKRRFERLWKSSDPIKNLDDYKKAWKTATGARDKGDYHSKPKVKAHTTVDPWDEEIENKWLLRITGETSKRTQGLVEEATKWKENEGLVSDLSFKAFNSLGTSDIIYLQIDYEKNRVPEIEKGRIIDKREVETGSGGNYHAAYKSIKKKKVEKNVLAECLKELRIEKSQEGVPLSNQQGKLLEQLLTKKGFQKE
jgi:hypothetical protein